MTFCKLFKLSSNYPSPISKKRKSRDHTRCDDCHTNTYSMRNWGWGFNTASHIVPLGPLGKGATKQGIYVTSFASNFRKVRTGVTFVWRRYFWRKAFSKTPGWSGYSVGENTTPGIAITPAPNPLLKLHIFLIYQWFIPRSHSIIRWTRFIRIISCLGSEDKWCWFCDDDSAVNPGLSHADGLLMGH